MLPNSLRNTETTDSYRMEQYFLMISKEFHLISPAKSYWIKMILSAKCNIETSGVFTFTSNSRFFLFHWTHNVFTSKYQNRYFEIDLKTNLP